MTERPKARGARPLLSVEEAAAFLGYSEKTVLRWIRAGDLKAFKLNRQWRISPEDLDAFLAMRATWRRSDVS